MVKYWLPGTPDGKEHIKKHLDSGRAFKRGGLWIWYFLCTWTSCLGCPFFFPHLSLHFSSCIWLCFKGVSKAAQLLSRYTHVTLIHYLFCQACAVLSHRGIEADLHHADEGCWTCASWKLLRDENESETNRRRQRRSLLLCCWRQEGHQNVNLHFFYHAYKNECLI